MRGPDVVFRILASLGQRHDVVEGRELAGAGELAEVAVAVVPRIDGVAIDVLADLVLRRGLADLPPLAARGGVRGVFHEALLFSAFSARASVPALGTRVSKTRRGVTLSAPGILASAASTLSRASAPPTFSMSFQVVVVRSANSSPSASSASTAPGADRSALVAGSSLAEYTAPFPPPRWIPRSPFAAKASAARSTSAHFAFTNASSCSSAV